MPLDKLIAVGLPIALGVVMIGAGAFNFIGPRSIHESLARWGIPPFSSGDGRARNDGRVAAADPGDLARRRDRQRRDTRLSLLFEVGIGPPHDGMKRMGRPNLSGALAAD
jgi:hypothetical protein